MNDLGPVLENEREALLKRCTCCREGLPTAAGWHYPGGVSRAGVYCPLTYKERALLAELAMLSEGREA
jgi:hypothetical protein